MGWGLTMVRWKDETGDEERGEARGEPRKAPPRGPHPNEESRKNLRTVEDINPFEKGLDDAGKRVVEDEVKRLEEAQCHHTSHCASDEHHIVKGRQTLFANAALETIRGQEHKQWPFLVDLELPRDDGGMQLGPAPLQPWSIPRSGEPKPGENSSLTNPGAPRYIPPHQRSVRAERPDLDGKWERGKKPGEAAPRGFHMASLNIRGDGEVSSSRPQWGSGQGARWSKSGHRAAGPVADRRGGGGSQRAVVFSDWRSASDQPGKPRPPREIDRVEARTSGAS